MSVIEFKKRINGEEEHSPRNKSRLLKDAIFRAFMGVGGVSVIGAILLIFFYLGYVSYLYLEQQKYNFRPGSILIRIQKYWLLALTNIPR